MNKLLIKIASYILKKQGFYFIATKQVGSKIEIIGDSPLKYYTEVEKFHRFINEYNHGRF